MTEQRAQNRLAKESSPYLLQHASNPVDWYPWGEEAFEKAKAEDKPILLSVGYSACQKCNVMAQESFEDEATADIMNRDFVSILVDSEERPDIDAIYMNAQQALTGQGAWPITIVMTPDAKPFFAGNYFPIRNDYGRASFQRILGTQAKMWQTRRRDVDREAENITKHLQNAEERGKRATDISEAILVKAHAGLKEVYDSVHGGFGRTPKLLPHGSLKFLLRRDSQGDIQGDYPDVKEMAYHTLDRMAQGGIYDQIGGGFSRHSIDEKWLVPQFEKILSDNAQLVSRYAEAYALTGKPLYKNIVEETIAWLKRDMLSPEGGFYSSLDAYFESTSDDDSDETSPYVWQEAEVGSLLSKGVEGKYYLWQEAEVDALLRDANLGEDAALVKAYFDISEAGNYKEHNILNVKQAPEAVAEQFGISLEELEEKIAGVKRVLGEARASRPAPRVDKKILCSWNGLMLTGLADAARILDNQDYLKLATGNAEFIRNTFYKDGRLLHSHNDGVSKINGLLEDYVYTALGMLSLYKVTEDKQWLDFAQGLAESILEQFLDERFGDFYTTPHGAEKLIFRPKAYFDDATPGANAAVAELLLKLSRQNSNQEFEDYTSSILKIMANPMQAQPIGFGSMLTVLDMLYETT